jgi:tetratricopeptide (TPR) repeat protein
VEKEIQTHLQQLGDVKIAAEALLRKFENVTLSAEDYHSLATFCFKASVFESLCQFITKKLQDGSFTPWGIFAAALQFSNEKIDPSSPLWQSVFEGAKSENGLFHLALFQPAAVLHDELRQIRAQLPARAEALKQESKKQWLEQVDFFKSQNLLQEEEDLLLRLEVLFPKDEDLRQKKVDFLNRRAERARSEKKKTRDILLPDISDEPEVQDLKLRIFEQMKELIQQDASLAKDFALSHLMWNSGDLASELLKSKSELAQKELAKEGLTAAERWLKVESLFQSHRYAELLAELAQISALDPSPEATFALVYWKAQALWGLKKPQEAMGLLEQLLSVRPQYRSAQALLSEWREALS